jgi:hypothetical protein
MERIIADGFSVCADMTSAEGQLRLFKTALKFHSRFGGGWLLAYMVDVRLHFHFVLGEYRSRLEERDTAVSETHRLERQLAAAIAERDSAREELTKIGRKAFWASKVGGR